MRAKKKMKTKNQGKKRRNVYFICLSAIIAALYVVLTLISAAFGLSSGVIQLRISEALCILPYFTPAAISGVTIGCLISNILTSGNPLDIIFGTLATFIGALGGYFLRRRKWFVSIPTVISNAVIIPLVLVYGFSVPESLPFLALTVGVGEFISASVFGMIFLLVLEKYNFKLR